MPYIELTAATVAQRLAGAELTALKTAALSSGQDGETLLADCISRTVAEVRGYVAAHRANVLGEGATIPDELEDSALALVVYKFITRLPGLKALLDERRVKAYEDALSRLREVAAGKFLVVAPVTQAAAQAGGSTIKSNGRTRLLTRERLGGL